LKLKLETMNMISVINCRRYWSA